MAASYRGDLYGRKALRDPYPVYRRLRDTASAVWMPRHKLWAVSRYDDVRAVLRADTVMLSGRGVAANDAMNQVIKPITLTSDADVHATRRRILQRPVLPARLKELQPRLEAEAARLVADLATGETFDAMDRFASHLPVTVVAELVGLNEAGRANMLRWAAATFDVLGVMNARGVAAMPDVIQLGSYFKQLGRADVIEGGWAALLFDAADRGDLSQQEAQAMVVDYVGPALDTTILATGHMVWRLATTQGAFDAVKADPGLIPGIVNETVRMASPIRGFTRYAADDFVVGDAIVPRGSRALVLFASANRDERHYERPDEFDVTRNPRDHLGWGNGPHICVGMHLARLEMEVLLQRLLDQVARIETEMPKLAWNNVLQGFRTLPTRFHTR